MTKCLKNYIGLGTACRHVDCLKFENLRNWLSFRIRCVWYQFEFVCREKTGLDTYSPCFCGDAKVKLYRVMLKTPKEAGKQQRMQESKNEVDLDAGQDIL